jgi:hypothetical protein
VVLWLGAWVDWFEMVGFVGHPPRGWGYNGITGGWAFPPELLQSLLGCYIGEFARA